jgi:hypothetical protein
MTTYYRDRAIQVDADALVVGDQVYRLNDLDLVWHRRGPRGAKGAATVLVRMLLVVAVLAAIAAVALALRRVDFSKYDTVVVLGGAIVGVVLAATVGLFIVEGAITLIERSHDRSGSEYQIWAHHHGADLILFATRDRLIFGKVYRALQRAIEQGGR